jgi:hypothetical protein
VVVVELSGGLVVDKVVAVDWWWESEAAGAPVSV